MYNRMKLNTTNILVALVFFGVVFSMMCYSCATLIPYNEADAFTKQFPYEGFTSLEYSNQNKQVSTQCEKVYGFDGLFCKPSVADNNIELYSSAKGDPSCFGKSAGLSNSKGSLCLDENQMNMLLTRGGNSTGKDSQIGQ
jgi:hypothetical protein